MILIAIYLIIICIIGTKIGDYKLFDCLWESKELIFTTLILSVIIPYYDYMKERHQQLDNQYTEYFVIYNKCTYIMNCFNKLVGIEDYKDMLRDNDSKKDYYYDLRSCENNVINYDDSIIKELIKYEDYLEESLKQVSDSVKKKKYIGNENITYNFEKNTIDVSNQYKNIVKNIKKGKKKMDLASEMIEMNDIFYQLLVAIRKPWRWDQKIDKKIDYIILKNGKCITDYDMVMYRRKYK